MTFHATFCDPFQPNIIDLVSINKEDIVSKFRSINWEDYLERMKSVKPEEIHFSHSLEIENQESKHGISISAVGEPGNYEFYIFYKRPKKVKALFGLVDKTVNDYCTDKTGQTNIDVVNSLEALMRDDTDFLSDLIGR